MLLDLAVNLLLTDEHQRTLRSQLLHLFDDARSADVELQLTRAHTRTHTHSVTDGGTHCQESVTKQRSESPPGESR